MPIRQSRVDAVVAVAVAEAAARASTETVSRAARVSHRDGSAR